MSVPKQMQSRHAFYKTLSHNAAIRTLIWKFIPNAVTCWIYFLWCTSTILEFLFPYLLTDRLLPEGKADSAWETSTPRTFCLLCNKCGGSHTNYPLLSCVPFSLSWGCHILSLSLSKYWDGSLITSYSFLKKRTDLNSSKLKRWSWKPKDSSPFIWSYFCLLAHHSF